MSQREHFSSYFTGLFEASGGIYIPKGKYPKIYINFHKDNLPLANIIRDRIGFGALYEKKTGLSYEIFNKEGILRFIEITSKYYRTPKIENFNEMINYLNNNKNQSLSLAILDKSPFESNAWLSGYLETSGSFFVCLSIYEYFVFGTGDDCRLNESLIRQTTFELKHKKDSKSSYELFLYKLASFFETSLKEKKAFNDPCFTIRFVNYNSVSILINYLNKYPLFGIQYINYCIFKNGYNSSMADVVYKTKTKDTKENKEYIIREILEIHPVTFEKYNHFNSPVEEIKANYIKEHLILFPKLD